MRRELEEEFNTPLMILECFIHPALELGRDNTRNLAPGDSSIHMVR